MVLTNSSTVTSAARVDAMVLSDCSMVRRMLEIACSMGWIVPPLKSSVLSERLDGCWDEGVKCSSYEGGPLINGPHSGPRCGVPGKGRPKNPTRRRWVPFVIQ